MEPWLIFTLLLLGFGVTILLAQHFYNIEKRIRKLEDKLKQQEN